MLVNSPEITLARSSSHNTCFVQSLTENSSGWVKKGCFGTCPNPLSFWSNALLILSACYNVRFPHSHFNTKKCTLINVSHTNSQCNAFHVPENFQKEKEKQNISCFLEHRNKENQQTPLLSALQRMIITFLFFLNKPYISVWYRVVCFL